MLDRVKMDSIAKDEDFISNLTCQEEQEQGIPIPVSMATADTLRYIQVVYYLALLPRRSNTKHIRHLHHSKFQETPQYQFLPRPSNHDGGPCQHCYLIPHSRGQRHSKQIHLLCEILGIALSFLLILLYGTFYL